jgi:hypothetical protein
MDLWSMPPDQMRAHLAGDLARRREFYRRPMPWAVRWSFPGTDFSGRPVGGFVHADVPTGCAWQERMTSGPGAPVGTPDPSEARMFASRAGAEFFISMLADTGPFEFRPVGLHVYVPDG